MRRAFLCLALGLSAAAQTNSNKDVVLRAMKDEIERSRSIRLGNLEPPYFVEYALDDTDSYTASASLGGLVSAAHSRLRSPRIQVRVGSYDFDNTNYLFSDYYNGSRYDPDRLPIEDNYSVLRRMFWLGTDRAYKGALDAIARKRAALQNVTQDEKAADFSKAPPVQRVVPFRLTPVDQTAWNNRIRAVSGVFVNYPDVMASTVQFESGQAAYYYANSEGTLLRQPDHLSFVRVSGAALTPDGMRVRDAAMLHAAEAGGLPTEKEMRDSAAEVAKNVSALAKAKAGESYAGPVLFEGSAGAQVFAELLGANLPLTRKPVSEPGRPLPFAGSELESRMGSRILPEWMDVVDDPTRTEWNGRPLLGSYTVDYEGVTPQPLTVVAEGKLKSFLLTRQPVRSYAGSNGRARLPGGFGARSAAISNLFVKAGQTIPAGQMKARLLQVVKERGLSYGIIVRKMDYPSSASIEELRELAAGQAQSGGGRATSIPLLVYKVDPEGREELVRGLRFRGLSTRSLKDILAASDDSYRFDYLYNQAPFALMGGANFVAPCTVVAPSLLFDDLELERLRQEQPKPPLVPPPTLLAKP